jgi:hypothetical protein
VLVVISVPRGSISCVGTMILRKEDTIGIWGNPGGDQIPVSWYYSWHLGMIKNKDRRTVLGRTLCRMDERFASSTSLLK